MKDLHGINISKLDSVEDMSRENQTSFLHSGVIKSCLDEDDDDDDVCACVLHSGLESARCAIFRSS